MCEKIVLRGSLAGLLSGCRNHTHTYTAGKESPGREPSWLEIWLQKPSILRVCVREEDAGGREAGAPSDLKMQLENGRSHERVSRGQIIEQTVSVFVCICREGGTPSSAAGRRRVPARRPPRPAPRHNGRSPVSLSDLCLSL